MRDAATANGARRPHSPLCAATSVRAVTEGFNGCGHHFKAEQLRSRLAIILRSVNSSGFGPIDGPERNIAPGKSPWSLHSDRLAIAASIVWGHETPGLRVPMNQYRSTIIRPRDSPIESRWIDANGVIRGISLCNGRWRRSIPRNIRNGNWRDEIESESRCFDLLQLLRVVRWCVQVQPCGVLISRQDCMTSADGAIRFSQDCFIHSMSVG